MKTEIIYRGFSLLECLFSLAIAAVLAVWAVPGYRIYVNRTHRAEAERRLLQLALREERYYAAHQVYGKPEAWGEKLLPNGLYRYAIEVREQGFRATATPIGGQAPDPCGRLAIDQAGERSSDGRLPAAACW